MTLYIQAHRADGSQILGNLDGQRSLLGVRDYRRTAFYRNLKSGAFRVSRHVHHWLVVDGSRSDTIIESIDNPHWSET